MTREELFPKILNDKELTKIGVEIGVFEADFSKHILNNWDGKLYLIDPWRKLDNEYIDISNVSESWKKAINNILGFEDRAFMLRGLSNQLVDLFSDNSLDFVYIDANHAYKYVKEDINIWYPKVKSGGILAGHDYLKLNWDEPPFSENGIDKHIWSGPGNKTYAGIFGVNPAVDEFCKINNYEFNVTDEWYSTWYITKK